MSGWGATVAVDETTRRIIRGSLTMDAVGTVEIRLPHRLESPNKMLHAHWRLRTKDKHAWRTRLLMVMADAAKLSTVSAYEQPYQALIDLCGYQPVTGRRIVRVERLVPSVRNFIKDRDNLTYSVKPLLDQVKKLGFLRDDSMEWIELVPPTQRVSDDGRDWTVIAIEVPAGENLPLNAGTPAETRER
jgi:hypothetical protein